MASRFIFHKFSSGMSKSTSLLGANASSSSARAATTPVTLIHRDTVRHPSNRGIHSFAWTQISKAARQAKYAAFKPKTELPVDERVKKNVDTTICLLAYSCLGWIYIFYSAPPVGSSSTNSGSSCCSHCCKCNCQCHGPNSEVQQD